MTEMLNKKGFCFIEVLSPCPTLYQRRNKMGDGLDTMKYYKGPARSATARRPARAALTMRARLSWANSWTATGPITWN